MKLAWDSEKKVDRHDGHYHRERSSDLYHTARWTKLSRGFRSEPANQLCRMCQAQGIIRAATCVDHIIPWPICGESGFFDRNNLQPLCDDCNRKKGHQDQSMIQSWKSSHQGQTHTDR